MITLVDNVGYFAFSLAIMATTAMILNCWLKKGWLRKATLVLTSGSTILMFIQLIIRTSQTGSIPVNSVYEFLLMFSFILLAFSVFWIIKVKIYVVASFILTVATILLGVSFGLTDTITPLMPALQSRWRVIHVLTAIISYSAFTVAFGVAIFYIISIPRKLPENLQTVDDSAAAAIHQRASFLEKLMFNSVVVGFVFLTLLIITGSIWAEEAWGAWWSWDPKETWALITWIIYAVYMHLHSKPAWKGHKGCYLSIIGFACVLFTLLGVSFLMGGLHSY